MHLFCQQPIKQQKMQSSNELLVSLDEIRTYVQLAKNINSDNRILSHIIESQQFDVMEWLGNEFYFDIWNNQASYTLLLNGGSYIYDGKMLQMFGLKPFICIMAGLRIIRENDLSATATGNVIKDTEQSTPASDSMRLNKERWLMNRALPYKTNIQEFLCRNKAAYPLYYNCADNKAVEDKTLQIFVSTGKYGNQKF